MSENPLQAVRRAVHGCQKHLTQAAEEVQQRWNEFVQPLSGHLMQAAKNVGLQSRAPRAMPPLFAAITAAAPWNVAPIVDLAMNDVEIRTRLAAIPVYTVANSKNEFVLVSDDKGNPSAAHNQLGLFFFNAKDAQALIDRIGQQDATMAKDTRVQTVTVDMVLDVLNRPEEEGLKGVSFRFMPDQQQVRYAMELYEKEGVPVTRLYGIPVFQAEGLSIAAGNSKFTPIFFAKEDLDAALGTAHTKRNSTQARQYVEKAERLAQECEAAQREYVESTDSKAKRRAKDRADKARIEADKAREKARKVEKAALPKVDVGCFEDVIVQMERDTKREWANVMFIPPGALSKAKS